MNKLINNLQPYSDTLTNLKHGSDLRPRGTGLLNLPSRHCQSHHYTFWGAWVNSVRALRRIELVAKLERAGRSYRWRRRALTASMMAATLPRLGLNNQNIQLIQNVAAAFLTGNSKRGHMTPVLKPAPYRRMPTSLRPKCSTKQSCIMQQRQTNTRWVKGKKTKTQKVRK